MILANISNSIHQDFQGSGVNYSNHMLYDISYFNISLQNLQYAFFTYLNRAATWWSYACFQRGCPFFPQPTGVWLPGGNERTICIHVEERRMSRGHDGPTWKLRFLPRGHCATKVQDADLLLSEFLQGHWRSACTAYIGGVLRMWRVLLLIE